MRFLILLLLMLAAISPAVSQTEAPKNDRIVGRWKSSSSGLTFTLAYSGQPDKFWVMIRRGAVDGVTYEAQWDEGDSFWYKTEDDVIYGHYDRYTDTFTVSNAVGTWESMWTREP